MEENNAAGMAEDTFTRGFPQVPGVGNEARLIVSLGPARSSGASGVSRRRVYTGERSEPGIPGEVAQAEDAGPSGQPGPSGVNDGDKGPSGQPGPSGVNDGNKNEDLKIFTIGDLLWAKCGNHPFWPCMVSYDPYKATFFRKKKVRSIETTIYHVQYFGAKVQHGWTTPDLIFPFKGEQDYYEKQKDIAKNATSASACKRLVSKYSLPCDDPTEEPGKPGKVKEVRRTGKNQRKTNGLEAWKIAVREAEAALDYELEERFESFVFKYELKGEESVKKGTPKKKKHKKNSNKTNSGNYDVMVCKICKKGSVDLVCSGTCSLHFHKACLGILSVPREFMCSACELGIPVCYACKMYAPEGSLKCNKCIYHYHEKCLKPFPYADIERKICPHHVCLTCYNEIPRKVSSKGPFIYCMRCPATFHATLRCTPVGSVKLKSGIICPEHFLGKKRLSPQPISNVAYCCLCAEGGEDMVSNARNNGGNLICCESCPNSYHARCINVTEEPPDYFCEDCTNKQYLYVGMIIWAKTGHFRWWPAQIVNVDELPNNVKNIDKYDGEFPIQYFGTDEYFWTHRGKVIPYADHHKDYCRSGSKQCKLDSYFKLSLEEASEAYDQYVLQRHNQNLNGQRVAYKHIKVNRAVPPAHIAHLPGKSVLPCSCSPQKPYPCGKDSRCLNRSMLMECHPDVCLAGDRCENQKFQRRDYPRVKVIKTTQRGWGLRTLEFIAKGSFVIEYVGEVITHEEYRRRVVEMQQKNIQNYYFLYLDSRRMIDAGPQGNLSRFINHSCSPNCEMSKWSVNGDSRIGIFAVKDIVPGEELSFNYEYGEFHQKCLCMSANCEGFIGKKAEKHKKLKSN